MTPFIDEAKRLLRIAGRDYQTFTILRNHAEAELAPTCFHAQQAVEKALKAVLTIRRIDFRRTHDLEELAHLLADIGIALPFAPREFRRLNPFAVEFRYDDESIALITRDEADHLTQRTLAWAAEIVSEFDQPV
ncbi:MAG: HEPN domain-containing protein [Gammaproteobacteria bacterium]